MQKKHLAVAALAATSGLAAAQGSVTVYGLIDTGIEYVNHASASGGSLTRVSSGAMNTSRIGFRGSEDLGGGLKAIFQLENGFKLDTGGLDGDANQLFNRQSTVGLEGSLGRIVAGRSFSTTYDFILPFDPMGYSAQYSWVTSAGATGARKDGMPTGVSNLVKYQGTFGGVKIGAMFGFGEVAGSTRDSAKYGVGLGYDNGPFSVAATYDRVNGTAAVAGGAFDKSTTAHLAAAYQVMESLKLSGGYRYYKRTQASGATPLRSDFYWGGATYRFTPALSLIGAVYYQNQKNLAVDADPILYSLRLKYALSKRTDLYASGGYAKAKNNQLVGLSRDDVGFADSQVGVTLGMQHRF
ncbi:porin [Herbaspirillum sp. YR522]|uniref:porin n=1 Tax=Herbaspirillum sp. YR522 TaxID=1144342 RepID=UPI00026FAB77|nr:porin [Herbaspirillum sp. YR522]EJM97725.1 outer membrane protein (porin) [Herbaspirillum sp. YR522]